MKRFIAAVSFAALAVPAFAAGLPYEQNVVDRTLPNIEARSASTGDTAVDARTSRLGAPYEQILIDRALPNIEPHRSASSGDTQTDRGNKSDGSSMSPWANDYNFTAPAP